VLKLAVTSPRPHVPPSVGLDKSNDVADFHRAKPLPAPPNGEVEGPHRSAGQATRAHNLLPRSRSQTDHVSRTPPTIVRALSNARARNDVPHEGSRGETPTSGQKDHPKCPRKRKGSLRVALVHEKERKGKRPYHFKDCDVTAE
jgi:hypothetical protein